MQREKCYEGVDTTLLQQPRRKDEDNPYNRDAFKRWITGGIDVKAVRQEAFKKVQGTKDKTGKVSYKEIYIPFFDAVAERMNKNKNKYPEDNYLKDIDINDLLDALQRHINKIRHEYKDDNETVTEHLAAIGCNAMMIFAQMDQRQ